MAVCILIGRTCLAHLLGQHEKVGCSFKDYTVQTIGLDSLVNCCGNDSGQMVSLFPAYSNCITVNLYVFLKILPRCNTGGDARRGCKVGERGTRAPDEGM